MHWMSGPWRSPSSKMLKGQRVHLKEKTSADSWDLNEEQRLTRWGWGGRKRISGQKETAVQRGRPTQKLQIVCQDWNPVWAWWKDGCRKMDGRCQRWIWKDEQEPDKKRILFAKVMCWEGIQEQVLESYWSFKSRMWPRRFPFKKNYPGGKVGYKLEGRGVRAVQDLESGRWIRRQKWWGQNLREYLWLPKDLKT